MKLRTLLLAILLSMLAAPMQARTVADFFGYAAADQVFVGLDSVDRLDMLDYFRSGMATPITNDFNGSSRLTALNDTSLTLAFTSGVEMTLTLLPGKQPVLMLVETLALPQLDSRISFYDAQWLPLKKSPLPTPGLAQWLTSEGKKRRDEVEAAIPFLLSTAAYDAASSTLTLSSTLPSYWAMNPPKELALLRSKISYRWNGKNFKLLKDNE